MIVLDVEFGNIIAENGRQGLRFAAPAIEGEGHPGPYLLANPHGYRL